MMPRKKYRYELVYDTLKDEIIKKFYDPGILLPPEKDIAQRFNVDRVTVRKGLDLLVKEGLVKKEAGVGTRVIGYNVDNKVGDGYAYGQKNCIGFFVFKDVHQVTQPYYADLFFHLDLQCQRHGYQVIYYTIDEEMNFCEIMNENNFIGVIFVASIPDTFVEQAISANIPMVIINRFHEQAVCIMADHVKGAKLAINYLVEMGHRDIGIIRGEKGFISDEDKMAGCLSAAFENDINLDKRFILSGNWEFQSGYENAKQIFSHKSSISALFCFNDIMALGAIKALREMNIAVGKEVSVMGFDNMTQLKFTEPDLSTVDCNIYQLAQMAVERIIISSKGMEDYPLTMHPPVKLVKGNTVTRHNIDK